MHSHSQELFTKEFQWELCDSVEILNLQNKDQIIEWSKKQLPFSFVNSKDFSIKGYDIYIVMVVGCSGLPCLSIYIFKWEDGYWQCLTSTHAILKEQIEIKVNNIQEKIIFETKSGQIGELPFETLNLSSDKAE